MTFKPNQTLNLPELAAHVGSASAEFRVVDTLAGGMGECVRVAQGQEFFALKVIQNHLIDDAAAWHRYLREARIWTTLSAGDGVVEAFCITRVNEIPVVCSRWMSGGNLRGHMKSRSPEFFFRVIARVVGTLAWAREQHDVIHRDIKPENILLDDANLAFVSDWGLARPLTVAASEGDNVAPAAFTGGANPALTAAGLFLGTVSYASPEQLLGSKGLDHRADIYSIGCLMYEWEAGSLPFTGTTAEEICLKHLLQTPGRLGSLFRKTTFGAEDVIRQSLEKDPGRRPDYASLESALTQAASRRGIRYEKFRPKVLYKIPMVGTGTYGEFVRSGKTSIGQDGGTYGLIERSDIQPFLREAEALTALGDYSKAAEIYGSLFVPQMVIALPDHCHNQFVTIGYAFCLNQLGRNKEAIEVLGSLSGAAEKPAEYFVNLSLSLIREKEFALAATTAMDGLLLHPDDRDIVGNLLVAQTALGAFVAAAETAKTRLAQFRNVHSLHEVAVLHCKYADSVRDADWPLAVKNYKFAVGLLREAKQLNPRFLPVRFQLAIALEAMTAYTQCSNEVPTFKDLVSHISDQLFLAYLLARCLDRVNAHNECLEFCDRWLRGVNEVQSGNPAPRHSVIRLERVRAATIADGFCIGKITKDGKRVVVPDVERFF